MKIFSVIALSVTLINSANAMNCECEDKDGDNKFTISNFLGPNCKSLVGQDDNTQVTLSSKITGNTTCTPDKSSQNFACQYQLQRVHIVSCKEAK